VEKLDKIMDTLEGLKVKDLVAYDFEKTSPFYDYFVIATTNERQATAAINYLKKELEDHEIRHVEGKGGSWVLIDAREVIIHLFTEEDRRYYGFDNRLLGVKRVR
jgi:ribosome-associated protein